MVIMTEETTASIRRAFHLSLIKKLISVYKTDKWKYSFIKNVKEKFDYSVQYHQLKKFEIGETRNENLINVMFLEIMSYEKSFTMVFESKNKVFIK